MKLQKIIESIQTSFDSDKNFTVFNPPYENGTTLLIMDNSKIKLKHSESDTDEILSIYPFEEHDNKPLHDFVTMLLTIDKI